MCHKLVIVRGIYVFSRFEICLQKTTTGLKSDKNKKLQYVNLVKSTRPSKLRRVPARTHTRGPQQLPISRNAT